ncbi:hypothetical protein [uncultured Enterovirga sp.]|uniref:hypothetical protein n=1 Tax=uncultured Enterovirga sp. TaxID=2026352 RepID=UPI0035C95911
MRHDLSVGRTLSLRGMVCHDPLTLTLGLVSGGLSLMGSSDAAEGQRDQAESTARAQEMQAAAQERRANEERAASQREAIARDRKTELTLSRTQAVAASSGAGADDPTVLDLVGDTAAEGEYGELTALYEGHARATTLDDQATISRFTADRTRRAGPIAARATMLSGLSSFASSVGRARFDPRSGL